MNPDARERNCRRWAALTFASGEAVQLANAVAGSVYRRTLSIASLRPIQGIEAAKTARMSSTARRSSEIDRSFL
jgi:hypothetical protein